MPPVAGRITSGFGMRFHPVLRIWKLHDGTDYGAPCGSPIRAPRAGRVSAVYVSAGYGNRLMIDHGVIDGRHVITGFNHATGYVVDVGQHVGRGQVIGYVGSTGFSTGCHLHLMLWLDGAPDESGDVLLSSLALTREDALVGRRFGAARS